MKKFIENAKEYYPVICEMFTALIIFSLVTLALIVLCTALSSDSSNKLNIEQDYAIQDIKDDLKREAFKDCLEYNQFSYCYKEFEK